jgi:hypothetical protein
MGEMRALVYNSNEEFELDGPVKPARDPVCGEVLKGEGAFFCMGDGRDEIQHAARRVMSSFALKEKEGGQLSLTIDEFAELATFLHQLDGFVERCGSSVGLYITSYEKVNKLFAKNMFWHFMFAKGLLLRDTRFMEKPYKTSFEKVWQRVDQSPDRLTYAVDSMLFLPSKAAVTVKHQLPYVHSSDDLVGALGLLRSQMEGNLEAYTEKMTIRAAAFSDRVEELLKSDFVDVVYVQTPDLYQDAKVIKEIQETMESGAP